MTEPELVEILELELCAVQRRLISAQRDRVFVLHCGKKAKGFLIKEGTDPKYGARPLKRAIDRHLVQPLSCLLSTGQIEIGDIVNVDLSRDRSFLVFTKEKLAPFVQIPIPRTPSPIVHATVGV